MKQIGAWILFFTIFFTSCKTDFDVNDEWKDITIVYCILNQNETINYAKIEKAFLGSADAYEMAQISDSLYYDNIQVTLEEYDLDGNVTNVFTLTKTTDLPKDSGIFASDKNILYKTDASLKSTNGYKYRLVVYNPETDKTTYGETSVIEGKTISLPIKVSLSDFNYSFNISWNGIKDARIYSFSQVFHYFEIDKISGLRTDFEVPMNIGTKISPSATYDNTMTIEYSPETFLKELSKAISPNENVYRVANIKALDIIYKIGGDALYTYMEVNAPTFGVIQEKPEYTNIVNGLGVISSVYSHKYVGKEITTETVDSIANSTITKHLGFVPPSSPLYQNQ